jgi:hypothetical protein
MTNAINSSKPLVVADGGTGATTLTDGGILLGNGVSAISATAVGATGTVLQGNTGSAPTYTATPSVTSISFDSGANNLNNYVENGTFTPTIEFGGGTTGQVYNATRVGEYTRIGDICMIRIIVGLDNKGSSTGAITISGLPFANAAGQCRLLVSANHLTYTGYVIGTIDFNAAEVKIQSCRSGTTVLNMTDANLGGSNFITVDGFYFV